MNLTRKDASAEFFPILLLYGGAFVIRGNEAIGSLLAQLGPLGPSLPLLGVTLIMIIWMRSKHGWQGAGLHLPLSLWLLGLITLGTIAARLGLGELTNLLSGVLGEEIDTSRFEETMPLDEFITFLVGMWIVGAFGEEVMHRGFILPRLAVLFGDGRIGWIIAILIGAAFFGMGHAYQGPAGIIGSGGGAIIYALAFLVSRRSVWPGVLAHGTVNTLSLMALAGYSIF